MPTATIAASTINTVKGETTHLWATMDGDDVGSVVKVPDGTTSMTAQLGGQGGDTHGSSTTVLQGTNDPIAAVTPASATWFTLTEKDTASTAISRTTTAILKEVKEIPLYVRPSQSGGTAADIDVMLVCRHPGH